MRDTTDPTLSRTTPRQRLPRSFPRRSRRVTIAREHHDWKIIRSSVRGGGRGERLNIRRLWQVSNVRTAHTTAVSVLAIMRRYVTDDRFFERRTVASERTYLKIVLFSIWWKSRRTLCVTKQSRKSRRHTFV